MSYLVWLDLSVKCLINLLLCVDGDQEFYEPPTHVFLLLFQSMALSCGLKAPGRPRIGLEGEAIVSGVFVLAVLVEEVDLANGHRAVLYEWPTGTAKTILTTYLGR